MNPKAVRVFSTLEGCIGFIAAAGVNCDQTTMREIDESGYYEMENFLVIYDKNKIMQHGND